MTPEQFRFLAELAARRDEKRYAFLRQLLVLASGALAALVAFHSGAPSSNAVARWALRLAWGTLGLGILSGAAALHGEVWIAAALASQFADKISARSSRDDQQPVPISATLPGHYKAFARTCYASLLAAVVALVTYALAQG